MAEKQFYMHPTSLVASDDIGPHTRIWAFCNVQQGVRIGADCNIGDHCFIETGVMIGDRVTLKNGVSLWNGVALENDVFVGPNAVFTNDVYPRSKIYPPEVDRTLVRQGASIGANAVIVAGRTIGRYALVGAGAVVTRDVPDFTQWYGNPASMRGYVCRCARRLDFPADVAAAAKDIASVCKHCGRKYALVDDKLIPR